MNKKWFIAGCVLGAIIAVLGRWDWAIACFIFCASAAHGQAKLDRARAN